MTQLIAIWVLIVKGLAIENNFPEIFNYYKIGVEFMVLNYLSNAAKKVASIDKEYLLVMLLFVIVLFGAKSYALSIDAPAKVEINDKTTFYFDIINNSDKASDLTINFFAPVKADVVAPSYISPNEKVTAKVTIYNKYDADTEVNSKIEAKMGDTTVQSDIVLVFKKQEQKETALSNGGKVLSGLFAFTTSLTEMSGYNLIDWIIFWVLVIVVAVLLISFIARVVKRA